MDTDVMSAFVVLAETMRSAGYAESTIEQNRRMFVCLNRFTTGGSYKEEAGRAFIMNKVARSVYSLKSRAKKGLDNT